MLNFISLTHHLAASYFVLGKRLGALNIGNVPEDCQAFIDHIVNMFTSTGKIIMSPLPLHKIWMTKQYKLLHTSMRGQFDIAMKYVEEKLKEIKESEEGELMSENEEGEVPDNIDFLTYMIKKGEMSFDEITSIAIGLMGAGVDTVSQCSILHYIMFFLLIIDWKHTSLGPVLFSY